MGYVRAYKKLEVYITAKELVLQVYELLRKFPKEEQYALCDQLRRAVISIPSNIAEGLGRGSEKEQVRFLEIAYGSLLEVETQLDIAVELRYITSNEMDELMGLIDKEAKLLSGMRSKRMKER